MGKGNKPRLVMASSKKKTGNEELAKGCNSPDGCLLQEDPPEDCSRNPDFVKVICDNEKCTRNQYLHGKCYDDWESKVIMGVQKSQSRARDYTDEQIRRRMWSRLWDITYRYCKCLCGGTLKRADIVELAEPEKTMAGAGQRNEGKNKPAASQKAKPAFMPKSQLPKLVQPSKSTYTGNSSISPWVAAGGSGRNAGVVAASKFGDGKSKLTKSSLDDWKQVQKASAGDNYIPGLFIGKGQNGKKTQRHTSLSTSSFEEHNSFKSPTTTTPPMSSFHTPMESPKPSSPEEPDEDWRVVVRKGRLSSSGSVPSGDQLQIRSMVPDEDSETDDDEPAGRVHVKKETYEEYKAALEAHCVMNLPNSGSVYDRHLFEIKHVLDEMNEALGIGK